MAVPNPGNLHVQSKLYWDPDLFSIFHFPPFFLLRLISFGADKFEQQLCYFPHPGWIQLT